MKITKLMVASVALLVLAALFVAPAAARGAIDEIEADDIIFVWEKNLNIAGLAGGDVTSLKFIEDGVAQYTISVGDATDFNVPTYIPDDYLGKAFTAFDGATEGDSVTIMKPRLALDVVLASSTSSSVAGKSIAEDTLVKFKVKSYEVGAAYEDDTGDNPALVKIKVQDTETGATFTEFGGEDLAALDIESDSYLTADIDLDLESTGTYSAWVEWDYPDGFDDNAPNSEAIEFTIRTTEVSVESNKDTVVRGNSFTVTALGKSKEVYFLYLEDEGLDADEYPVIPDGQDSVYMGLDDVTIDGVTDSVDDWFEYYDDEEWITDADLDAAGTYAILKTGTDGTRKVQFDTDDADDRTYTVHIVAIEGEEDDEVDVKVEKGDVTIVASGDASYYLGEEISFEGTNTDSTEVYLFITGPNLQDDGTLLEEPYFEGDDFWDGADWKDATLENLFDAGEWDAIDVDSDDTWEFDWNTAGADVDLDAGTYTVYAISGPGGQNDLSDWEYDSISIVLKKAFVTATTSADTVAKGDSIYVTGTAEGNPDMITIWVFGKNKLETYDDATIEDDGSFEQEIEVEDWTSGQYFVVVQHPMGNGDFDVYLDGDEVLDGVTGDVVFEVRDLQGSDAAQALVDALDSSYIDDTYNKLDFLVEEAWITIDAIGDKYVGDVFTITGETNLGAGDEILIEVTSSAFKPTEKTQSGEFSGDAGTTEVVKGDVYNEWSFEVDASDFKPDEYIVKVESVDTGYTATTTFDVLTGAAPTEEPTVEPTEVPTEVPTEEPTEEPVTEPTAEAPGFGALMALIGLGAVAVLVLRKH